MSQKSRKKNTDSDFTNLLIQLNMLYVAIFVLF